RRKTRKTWRKSRRTSGGSCTSTWWNTWTRCWSTPWSRRSNENNLGRTQVYRREPQPGPEGQPARDRPGRPLQRGQILLYQRRGRQEIPGSDQRPAGQNQDLEFLSNKRDLLPGGPARVRLCQGKPGGKAALGGHD